VAGSEETREIRSMLSEARGLLMMSCVKVRVNSF